MAGVLRQEEQQQRPAADAATVPGAGGTDRSKARAFLAAGLTWAGVVVLAWLVWWLIGDGGREALARTVGLSAAQLAPFVVVTLIVEKLAAKALLFAALYHWVREGR
jgi:hypothetical protein